MLLLMINQLFDECKICLKCYSGWAEIDIWEPPHMQLNSDATIDKKDALRKCQLTVTTFALQIRMSYSQIKCLKKVNEKSEVLPAIPPSLKAEFVPILVM
jgi:hypothetical protein